MRLTPEESAVIRKMREEKLTGPRAWQPKADHTDAEKIAAFDKLRQAALEDLEKAKQEGYRDDDAEHYIYEDVMKLTLGQDVFEILNKLCQ